MGSGLASPIQFLLLYCIERTHSQYRHDHDTWLPQTLRRSRNQPAWGTTPVFVAEPLISAAAETPRPRPVCLWAFHAGFDQLHPGPVLSLTRTPAQPRSAEVAVPQGHLGGWEMEPVPACVPHFWRCPPGSPMGSSNVGATPNTRVQSPDHTLQLSPHTQVSAVGSAFRRPLGSDMSITSSCPADECLLHARRDSRTELLH